MKEIGTCSACKWWERRKDLGGYDQFTELCNLHIEQWEGARKFLKEHGFPFYGNCKCSKFNYDDIPNTSDGLSYMDCEGYAAGFVTGQDFGCIHFEI
jgi:hypothetical protein